MAEDEPYYPMDVSHVARERVGKALRPDADADSDGEASGPQTIAAGQLRAIIERIERLEEDKTDIGNDIKEVYAEAKGIGFDTRAIRTLVRLRKKDQAERQEEEAILDRYKVALGM